MDTKTIDLNTPEGRQWAMDCLFEKTDILHVIVAACRTAICRGDTRALHAELAAIDGVADECEELLEVISSPLD